MKLREGIGLCVIAILIALLFRSCGKGEIKDVEYIKGDTDTILHVDTFYSDKVINKPVPYKVYVYVKDSNTNVVSVDCDSIREYKDSIRNPFGKAVVESKVKGFLLNQHIIMENYLNDTLITRVDTLKITNVINFAFGVHGSADLVSGLGAGIDVDLRRWRVGYTYYPVVKSSQITVGWRLFGR